MKLQKILNETRKHLTDTVGLMVVSTPSGAFLENVLAGMEDGDSLRSRFIVGGAYLVGLGRAIAWGRKRSRRFFNITEETKEKYQHIHDMAYIGAVTLMANPLIYLLAGARDPEVIRNSTLLAAGVATGVGGLMGYSVDLFGDLTNYKPSQRVPERLRNANTNLKKALAVGLVAGSIGLSGLIYQLTPPKPGEIPRPQALNEYVEVQGSREYMIDSIK